MNSRESCLGQYNIIERLQDKDKSKVYEYQQLMINTYKRLKAEQTEETICTYEMAEWLPYLYGDVPYIDGAELDAWNEKCDIAHQMQKEWIAQDIGLSSIEEYYYNQCGQSLLLRIK